MPPSIPDEVEAKLKVPRPADLRAIAALRQLGSLSLRPASPQTLHTRYLDTRDLALARHGIALRVRRSRRRWELTAKWDSTGKGLVRRRPEYTAALSAPPASPFVIPDPFLQDELSAIIAGRPLDVVLVSDIRRRRLWLERGADPDKSDDQAPVPPLAEVALDLVHLHAMQPDGPSERYAEVEIELRSGSEAEIERAAEELQQRFQLEPARETKFARGLALVHGFARLEDSVRDLAPSDDIAAAARKIVGKQLQQIRRHDPGTRRGTDPEELHDLRVAIRRLRAARKTLGAGIPDSLRGFLRDELRWIGTVTGAVRDLDVQLERAASFAQSVPAGLRDNFATYSADLQQQREVCRHEMLEALRSKRYARLLLRLERFAAGRSPRRRGEAALPAAGLAADALAATYRRLLRQGKKVHAQPLPEELHALRIRAKRVRYVLEFFGEIAGKPARRAARRLARLQDLLGAYNDAVVNAEFLQRFLDGPGSSATPATVVTLAAVMGGVLEHGEELRRDFGKCWKRFSGEAGRKAMETAIERLGSVAAEAVANNRGER